LVLAACLAAAFVVALAACLALARRKRGVHRLRSLVDPATGLPSAARLTRDLRILSRAGDAAGTHLLALLELPGAALGEHGSGQVPADELLRSIGRRLSNAVGRAGSAYALERGRYGILARVGRGSEHAFLRAASAAVSEGAHDMSGAGGA
jgi:hypothetical protein